MADRQPVSAAALPEEVAVTRVEPSRGWRVLKLGNLWKYREMLYFLSWRDVKVRYKQTLLGAGWAILQPFLTMLIFLVLFRRVANFPSGGVPYPIFAYAGLVVWIFFSYGLTQASNSLVLNAELVRKVYFPRLAVPLAAILPGVLDFAVASTILIGMMVFYGIAPTINVLWLPAFLLLALLTTTGLGVWLSALSVQYRDVRFAVPFMVQVWLFATPVAYPATVFGEPWRSLLGLNPMSGVVEGFRWSLLGTDSAVGSLIGISTLTAVVILVSGSLYFARVERTFADVI